MPDWFLWAIVAMCVTFALIKGRGASSKRKKATSKETRDQKIRRMERELRELRRNYR